MTVLRFLMLAVVVIGWTGPARADLKICNETDFVQVVSIGYKTAEDWTSEGWWSIEKKDCAVVISGALADRYYYYRAEVNGGDFDGENYFFCTDPKVYTIVGDANCDTRGYDREAFRQLDVGNGITDYTLTLVSDAATVTPPAEPTTPPATPTPAPVQDTTDLGLKICNETEFVQGISIAYKGDPDWTSEGWWNIDPHACSVVISGELKQRYYYYRAEIDGGPFDAGSYPFCTDPKIYTIVGNLECASRGYVSEDFAEIDTGTSAKGFTFTLVADTAPTPTAPTGKDAPKPPLAEPTSAPAPAGNGGLSICNETDQVQEVSIGYKGATDWTSEGWWNIDPKDCARVLATDLTQQYYYYRAEVSGGPFTGTGNFFCTTPEVYEIVGDQDCEGRGYVREDFAEINVGQGVTDFTFTLVPSAEVPVPSDTTSAPETAPAEGDGLRICNDTAPVQAISIGYETDDGWTSEGWWNLEQNQCATVISGELKKRYYYYRAEVDGGPFEGGGYGFCTMPEVYTIVGDTDCESRGYVREDFAEIDTGPTAKSFVFTLTDTTVPTTTEPELFEETAPTGTPAPDASPAPESAPTATPEPAGDGKSSIEVPQPTTEPAVVPTPDQTPVPAPADGKSPTPRSGGSRGG